MESRTIAQLRYELFHLLYFLLLSVHQTGCNKLDTGLKDVKYQLQHLSSSAVVCIIISNVALIDLNHIRVQGYSPFVRTERPNHPTSVESDPVDV